MLIHRYSNIPTIGASAPLRGSWRLFHPVSALAGPDLDPHPVHSLFHRNPAYFFWGSGSSAVSECRRQRRRGRGSGLVGTHRRFVFGMLVLKIFDALPGTGMSDPMRRLVTRNSTDRLQLVRPAAQDDSLDLYATVRVSSHEARSGAGKMVSIPSGFQKRLLRVRVPPGSPRVRCCASRGWETWDRAASGGTFSCALRFSTRRHGPRRALVGSLAAGVGNPFVRCGEHRNAVCGRSVWTGTWPRRRVG